MSINLHIEQLIIDGIDIAPSQHHLLQASVTTELTQLLNGGGFSRNFSEGAALPKLSTSKIQLNDTKPIQFGQQIAQSLYGGIKHE